MKAKKIGIAALAVLAAAVAAVMFFGHGDEQVAGVALTDTAVSDYATLDGIVSSKGKELSGFAGALYYTANIEFGKYAQTPVSPIPEGKDLYACVLFVASPKGMEYKAAWSLNGQAVKEETKAITSETNREAVCYLLEGPLVQKGAYLLEIYMAGKRIYSQKIDVG